MAFSLLSEVQPCVLPPPPTMPMVASLVAGTIEQAIQRALRQPQGRTQATQCIEATGIKSNQANSSKDATFAANVKRGNVLASVRDKHGSDRQQPGQGRFRNRGRRAPPPDHTTISRARQICRSPSVCGGYQLEPAARAEEERTESYSFLSKILREDRDTALSRILMPRRSCYKI